VSSSKLVEHFFRHEYGRLVSVLCRRVGLQHVEIVEDAVQSALMAALRSWTTGRVPNNPSAWVFRVARNNIVGELRAQTRHARLASEAGCEVDGHEQAANLTPEDINDSLLRMLFLACDGAIPIESQLVFALKTLCGFDIREIAERLFTTEANVYKRIGRARQRLRERPPATDEFTVASHAHRRPAVLAILYVLFTEGYLSSHPVAAIRRELSEEALRLTTLLAQHAIGQTPETFALVALMHLHLARFDARQDALGGLVLLNEQDRARWDQRQIQTGLAWLAQSATGDELSRYHAEAGIAAEHCLAASLADTRWDRIVECYELLERVSPSPLHTLNRAVAIAEWRGPEEGLAVVSGIEPPTWLEGSFQWSAVLADLHRRCGQEGIASRHANVALAAAPSPAIREALDRRLRGARAPPQAYEVTNAV
jgi:RNA polymerase sigma factor (sigma-70 family)